MTLMVTLERRGENLSTNNCVIKQDWLREYCYQDVLFSLAHFRIDLKIQWSYWEAEVQHQTRHLFSFISPSLSPCQFQTVHFRIRIGNRNQNG